ncbi:MAG: hypothetical protein E7438_08000 [Ruminococcaceae bacterium]|nr:hypothetical protein [Oscillospiraceae bacterium]
MSYSATHSGPRIFSGNALKCIAATTMVVDHIGVLFFPYEALFRIIGRLAFPIFAFMIAEGCHYTRHRLRYFLGIFLLGAVCQVVYFVASGDVYWNVLLTFSGSIPVIYLLQEWKTRKNLMWMMPFSAAVAAAYVLNQYVTIDYGFWGMMLPVFVALIYPEKGEKISGWRHLGRVGLLTLGLVLLACDSGKIQFYSLLAVPILLLYSGKRGKGRFKYGFYLFYPLHLVALQVIAWLLA